MARRPSCAALRFLTYALHIVARGRAPVFQSSPPFPLQEYTSKITSLTLPNLNFAAPERVLATAAGLRVDYPADMWSIGMRRE